MSTAREIQMKAKAAAMVIEGFAQSLHIHTSDHARRVMIWRLTLLIIAERAQRQITYAPR